jgi:hypothetical protein
MRSHHIGAPLPKQTRMPRVVVCTATSNRLQRSRGYTGPGYITLINSRGTTMNTQRAARRMLFCALLSGVVIPGVSFAQSPGMPAGFSQAYQELFAISQKDKKGLTFYLRGQQIGGSVTKVIGTDAVEIRNQSHSRIIIRLDQIDAVAIN